VAASGLLEANDGFLYGTTVLGGGENSGVLFKIGKAGTEFAVLHNFKLGRAGFPHSMHFLETASCALSRRFVSAIQ
jgi:uncharacterized repeat protein (TIGR03803 family)